MSDEAVADKWQLVKIGDTIWLTKLDGDEPLIYYYHTTFKNFVRAPIYVGPPPEKGLARPRSRTAARRRKSPRRG